MYACVHFFPCFKRLLFYGSIIYCFFVLTLCRSFIVFWDMFFKVTSFANKQLIAPRLNINDHLLSTILL
jgi:hypothetical protein